MADSFADHASDDLLEAYSLGRLVEPDLGRLEEHLIVCEACRVRLRDSDVVVRAAQWALRQLHSQPIDVTHLTEDGPVRLLVEPRPDGTYRASIVGFQLECAKIFETVAEANEYVIESFREMFNKPDSI